MAAVSAAPVPAAAVEAATTGRAFVSLLLNWVRRTSLTWRLEADVGSTRSSDWPSVIRANGLPSTTSRTIAAVATGIGHRITNRAMRCHTPSSGGRGACRRTASASTLSPSPPSSAGSTTTEANPAMMPTATPA